MNQHPVVQTLKRYLDSNDFPFLLPLPPWAAAEDRAVRQIRQKARTVLRRRDIANRGLAPVCCSMAIWPAMALFKAWKEVRSGFRLHPAMLPSLIDAWWLQLAHNIRLSDLHHHRLDLPGLRRRVRSIVTGTENKSLMETLNHGHIAEDLGEKVTFAGFCSRHQLPAPPLLSSCRGHGAPVEHARAWPASDLFFKPGHAWGGQGMRRLRYCAARGVWQCDGEPAITPANIGEVAGRLLTGGPWLLQPRLANSSELADLVPSPEAALATIRVITGRILPSGPVEIISGFMRFPLRHAIVDNLCAGGLGADYDPRTGCLQAARHIADQGAPLSHHPETGGQIEGRTIPRWPEIAALARHAHSLVADIATLGWDIALTSDGPTLIETNPNWGVPLDTPLGATSYPRFILQPALRTRLP